MAAVEEDEEMLVEFEEALDALDDGFVDVVPP
jgi:hypothetical protein